MTISQGRGVLGTEEWKPRRVVSAVGVDGKAQVGSDHHSLASLELAGQGSTRFFNVWQTENSAQIPIGVRHTDPAASLSDMSEIFPGPGGSHLTISVWPPAYPPADMLPMWMHSTDTVDYIIVISGEITCFFDGGQRVTLSAGDCLIQNGTEHAWRNEGAVDCVMAAVAIGATRVRVAD